MLQIHQALQSGGYPNATTLARQLEVSTKSIHRDLEFMRDRLELPDRIRRQPVSATSTPSPSRPSLPSRSRKANSSRW